MPHSLTDFAKDLTRMTTAVELWQHHALDHAGQVIEDEAKRVIGTYDYNWEQLAESTQEQRVSLGYSANEPLLRDGTLRDSISHHVEVDAVYIGSTSKIAVYQELGTSRIPPRSFLAEAAMHKELEIQEEISHGLYAAGAATLGLTAFPKK